MGTTRWGLRYPTLPDAPHGPVQLQQLADDVDARLYRAFPCTDATKPPLTVDDRGFLIDNATSGNLERWTGSAWQVIGATTGEGGGGGSTGTEISATYAATAAQPISTGADTVVAFGVELAADGAVVRSPHGAGHRFAFGQTRRWTITATLRFAQNAVGGRRFDLVTGSGVVLSSASGPINTAAPWTTTLAVSRRLAAGTTVHAIARHNAGTGIALEPDGGSYVHIDIGAG